ncbi:UDP-glucose 6-dehydrogenase [Streptococcus pneumoniae]|nr:UDP-glucose 6-dehydrogenase [Streptococcus pneumoniae]
MKFFCENNLNITFFDTFSEIKNNIDYYIIALPTDYDEKIGSFNTYEIEQTVSKILRVKPNGKIILKSTVPIGFSNKLKRLFDTKNIIFVPEFLREGCSIYDNLYPSRIVVGDETVEGRKIAELFLSISTHSTANIKNVMLVSPTEAEAIKLFSNTFLALRVAFFNELDSFAERRSLNAEVVIKGVCLDPSRIVVGDETVEGRKIAELFLSISTHSTANIKNVMLVSPTEAEAIKLFSNTFLALRVAFFNELDSFAERRSLNAEVVIKGVCLDPRIGNFYNNPSFGFGGYCLPKDTKQLKKEFIEINAPVIEAIDISNTNRKQFIVKQILERKPKIVGIYKLGMKYNSDNYKESAILNIINELLIVGIKILVYEPNLNVSIDNVIFEKNFELFTKQSDLIVANRWDRGLEAYKDKVYTRGIWIRD